MPSKSKAQERTMQAIAHGWKPSGKAADIPVSVAKEYAAADKGRPAPKAEHVKHPHPSGKGSRKWHV